MRPLPLAADRAKAACAVGETLPLHACSCFSRMSSSAGLAGMGMMPALACSGCKRTICCMRAMTSLSLRRCIIQRIGRMGPAAPSSPPKDTAALVPCRGPPGRRSIVIAIVCPSSCTLKRDAFTRGPFADAWAPTAATSAMRRKVCKQSAARGGLDVSPPGAHLVEAAEGALERLAQAPGLRPTWQRERVHHVDPDVDGERLARLSPLQLQPQHELK